MSVWTKWRERRERTKAYRRAVRNGMLTEFHRETIEAIKARNRGSFVADVQFHRSEELRPDRLGPDETMLEGDRDPWRPKRTLGPLP